VVLLSGCSTKQVNIEKGSLELEELNYNDIKDKLIRFHVIANSDSKEDQNLKLKVRDKVVEVLSEKLASVKSIEEAEYILTENIECINKISKEVIEENNYAYEVNTMLSNENFPNKVYGDYIFPQGNYKAFRVIIGDGKGQNWWCVMFPSLCFVDESKNEVDSDTLKEEIECIEPKNEIKTNENKDNNKSSNSNNKIKFKVKLVEVIKDALD
jgi:stage II sporulation protein R